MNSSSVARRYARALFELAVEKECFEEAGRELAQVENAFLAEPSIQVWLRNPSSTRQEALHLAEIFIRTLRLSPLVSNGLRLLADRGRLNILPEVARYYGGLADDRAGRLRARIVSAVPLGPDAIRRIGDALSRATKQKVMIERQVDPSIIGGVIAQVGCRVFDGSIKNQISEMKNQLKG